MSPVYCISGFGSDERVFSKLILPGYELHFIKWLLPQKNESLDHYAGRMAAQIHHANPIIIGLSFGGMMSIEIARQIETKAVILISSVKTKNELPPWMRLAGASGIYKYLPLKSFKLIQPLENYNLGLVTDEEKQLVKQYRKNIDQRYSNWAIHTILNWKNEWTPNKLFHIHGDKDRIFSIARAKDAIIISGGGHMMIMNRAAEVSSALTKILATL